MRYGWSGSMVLALAILGGSVQAAEEADRPLTPAEAVAKASRVNGRGVNGTFQFEVKAVGTDGSDSFINSEANYRNPRCLTVRLSPRVREALEARLGGKLDAVLVGRQILVRGAAGRVRIVTVSQPDPTGKQYERRDRFYYQTQIHVKQADQIELI